MPETIIEIPDLQQGENWVPPVIMEQTDSFAPAQKRSCIDIFFAQYAICIILITVVLLLRLLDPISAAEAESRFVSAITQPDASWVRTLAEALSSLWN